MSTDSDWGRFVWADLMTTDVEAAHAFYTNVVGWTLTDFAVPEGAPPYRMFTAGETPVGGCMTLPPPAVEAGAPPHWICYVSTPDSDATAAEAERLGGKIFIAEDIPTVGRFAVLADPEGAAFAAFTPKAGAQQPPEGPTPVGRFSWHELAAGDHEAVLPFYQKLFGWERSTSMEIGSGVYQLYRKGETDLGGMYSRPPEMPVSCWLPYICVESLDDSLERARARGATIMFGPHDTPGGRVAMGTDPQGAMFALHEHGKS